MWTWIESLRKFFNQVTEKYLNRSGLQAVREADLSRYIDTARSMARLIADGTIGVDTWESGMRSLIKNGIAQQYLLGSGGFSQMTPADYGSLGGMAADQYRYLSNFAREIAQGTLTKGQIEQRAVMYANSMREAYERGQARSYGIPDGKLPAYPGGGGSCLGLTNCRCQWRIVEKDDRWECYWELGGSANNCDLCLEHSKEWNPLVIEKEQ